ncbi:hypothetical protein BDV30DRAFT_240963 [Aspergillus minisclerotigenes]|uniref:Carrier domain-containing protein n=1 Tax=Aspergillus minisclerotigenes TaxID=656917 RepID=A0A5N6IWX0_9EURO|nr:hypothetical protein BDV30DRAFT_240963 [Aspergillus minisclerotigenes]
MDLEPWGPLYRKQDQDGSLDNIAVVSGDIPSPHPTNEPSQTSTLHIPRDSDLDSDIPSVPTALIIAWGLTLSSLTGDEVVGFDLLPFQGDYRDLGARPYHFLLKFGHCEWSREAATTGMDLGSASSEGLPQGMGDRPQIAPNRFRNVLIIKQCSDATGDSGSPESPPLGNVGEGEPADAFRADMFIAIQCDIGMTGIDVRCSFDPTFWTSENIRMILLGLSRNFNEAIRCGRDDTPLTCLEGISPKGLDRVLRRNIIPPPPKMEACVHHRFQARCRQNPSALAIDAWDGQLTYAELDSLSSQLASRLVSSITICPRGFMGVLMEKSAWVPVAILAILKVGGAFVLLDGSQPLQRLRIICAKTKSQLVLSSAHYREKASTLGPPVLLVEKNQPGLGQAKENDGCPSFLEDYPQPQSQPQDTLYAVFTSGSTGEPKGAMVDHGAFCTMCGPQMAARSTTNVSPRVFQFAPHAFTISILDYLGTLLQGGCVCVPSEEELRNNMAGALEGLSANIVTMTPSMARVLDPRQTPSLKMVLLAGEMMAQCDLDKWSQCVRLMSFYGQSENAAGSMISEKSIVPRAPNTFETLTPGYQCWIVSQDNPHRLMALGEVGELLLEGPALGQGYMNDPIQTEDKFICRSFCLEYAHSGSPQSYRLFKTGDLVRYTPAGEIELLGRKGAEVKLRGQRIDLTEIEHHLRCLFPTATRVVADVIVPSDDIDGLHPVLTAFVQVDSVSRTGQSEEATFASPRPEFRAEAKAVLSGLCQIIPSYMVPMTIIPTEAFPFTATGKLDRRSLRQYASAMSRSDLLKYVTDDRGPVVTAVTPVEIIIHDACVEALGVSSDQVGMLDSFPDLGGDSLAARRMASICRTKGLELAVADILAHSSLTSLAAKCSAGCGGAKQISQGVETLDPFSTAKGEFLSDLPSFLPNADMIADVFPVQGAQRRAARAIDTFIFRLSGPVDAGRLRDACQVLQQAHLALRSIFVPFYGKFMQVVLRAPPLDFTRRLLPDGTDLVKWAESVGQADKTQRPPPEEFVVRFTLAETAGTPDYRIFMIRLSHAQYDAGCLARIISDLWAVYEQEQLVVKSDFAQYARRAVQQTHLPSMEAFWRNLLAGTTGLTPLPVTGISAEEERTIIVQQRVELKEQPPTGISMATVVRGAWSWVLHQQTRNTVVVFNEMLNGRDVVPLEDPEPVVGACHSIVPVCVHFPLPQSSRTPRELLSALQEQHLASLTFTTLDRDYLIQNCTEWTSHQSGFILAYQNFPEICDLVVGEDLSCQWASQVLDLAEPGEAWVTATPLPGALQINLRVSTAAMDEQEANAWISALGQTIIRFLDSPDSVL